MKYAELVNAVNEILGGYSIPLTLRQVYYRLVARGLIANTRSDYNQLSSQLVKARESGEVDGDRFEDHSRRIDDVSFDSPEHFTRYCENVLRQNYVRRFWDSQDVYLEIWVEKDALSAVLAQGVYAFNTIVCPARGYSSFTYLRDAATRIARYCQPYHSDERHAVILYFGDHDPSGLDMTRDLEARLANYCTLNGNSVEVKRVALNYEQVQQYHLIPNPVKSADMRSAAYIKAYGPECWELDAVEPGELVRLCQDAVSRYISDPAAWRAAVESERRERDALIAGLGA